MTTENMTLEEAIKIVKAEIELKRENYIVQKNELEAKHNSDEDPCYDYQMGYITGKMDGLRIAYHLINDLTVKRE